jgi:ubiquitin-conjugating enzyme E2 O
MDQVLYPDDLVVLKIDETRLASVERTSDSLDFHVPFPHNGEAFIDLSAGTGVGATTLQRFKATGAPPKGTILVRWENEALQLIRSDSVSLIVRSLLIGDIVKRDVSHAQSGVVINTSTKCSLRPLCDVSHSDRPELSLKGLPPPHSGDRQANSPWTVLTAAEPPQIRNVPASELMYSDPIADLTSGDLVVYKDWIGRIRDKSDSVCVKLTDGCVVEIPGEHGEHLDGVVDAFAIGDVLQTKKGVLRNGTWIYGSYSPNTLSVGTVVRVRPSVVEVDWLQNRIGSTENEPPGVLQDAEWESTDFVVYDRSRRPAGVLTDMFGTLSNSELDLRLYQRVRFRDLDAASAKYFDVDGDSKISRHDRKDNMGFDLNVFDVIAFRTEVSVQWQDLSISVHDSAALVPDSGIDDNHAAWPGEITHSLTMLANDASLHCERPEKVGVVQTVNAAARMATVSWNSESYIEYNQRYEGQQSVDAILRHHVATGRGSLEEISLYDIDTPAQVNVRRGDIVLINGDRENGPVSNDARDRTWLGEIVDTPLDGSLVIRLGVAESVRDVKFLRKDVIVAVRSDDTDAIEDELWNENDIDSEMEEALEQAYEDTDQSMWDEFYAEEQAYFEDENGMELDAGAWEDEAWEDAEEELEDRGTDKTIDSDTITTSERPGPLAEGSAGPEAYVVLETAVPTTHRFAAEEATVNASRMKRIQKDHRILASSDTLPVGVFVRTWETRLDLLRFLIIGPTETPYANAPFIIDMYLPPAYPTEPPKVYFHSWLPEPTSGTHGRLNPNLYEDGTICLSLLGTWDGAPGEGWSPTKSTVLQVIVSILGLVLVREPYYNEAGYEALVGTQAAKLPSSVYSERVFLRSRGLIITALKALLDEGYREAPGHETFTDILRWMYHADDGPKLLRIVTEDVATILERSNGSEQSNGLTIVSQGACIPLRRVLARLQAFKRPDLPGEE